LILDPASAIVFKLRIRCTWPSSKSPLHNLNGTHHRMPGHAISPQEAITVVGQPYGSHQLLRFRSGPVFVSVGSGLATPGYTLVADETVAGELFGLLASKASACCFLLNITS
jgi:hypothetical protein